jgi:nucleotide-binding universal stress UspA family protein
MRRIVVATNGADGALSALTLAAALAQRDAVLVLLICVQNPVWPLPGAPDAAVLHGGGIFDRVRRRKLLQRLEEQVRSRGGDPKRWILHIEVGAPAPAIVRFAAEHHADLIVLGLGAHALADRLLGSETTLSVMRSSRVPILAVHPACAGIPTRALVAVDFGEECTNAARVAASLVGAGGELHLVHVSNLPVQVYDWDHTIDSEAIAERRMGALVDELGHGARTVMHRLKGRPVDEILRLAARIEPDLIAAGGHKSSMVERLVLGSVATRLLRKSPCTVLIAPPTPLAAQPAKPETLEIERSAG